MDNWLSQLAAFSVLGLLLFTGVSTATSSLQGDDEQADGDDVVFSRDYIIIGQRPWTWNDSFTTSPDCESVRLNVTFGPMLTGSFGIYIGSVENDSLHTVYGSPFQIFGFPILGTGSYHYFSYSFVSGEQAIRVGSSFCFGTFHVEVTEAPWPPAPHDAMANPISTLL